jgi:DNA-binding response OmpR family regulator
MVKRNILVLERNEKIRATLQLAAKRAGFEYHELNSNEQLFRYLNAHPVDVILTNSSQQGIGARSICTILRNDPQFKRFPLIILYGKPGKTTRIDYLNQGADDFVEMPFSPAQLMDVVKSRLRPLADAGPRKTSSEDKVLRTTKALFSISPLDSKGTLEVTPPAAIFARLFIHKESGILDLIIDKETRTLYFKNGDLIFAETLSKKDDIDDFLARNRAGSGSGKELIAARVQSGGPKSDPNTYAMILKESKLLDPVDFSWWLRIYLVDMMANLFIRPHGVYQWQSLEIPEYATQTSLEPFSTPRILFEGIRRMKKWWAHRELLPEPTSIPHLSPDFFEKAWLYGLTVRETAMMQIINGKRTLRNIGEICHVVCPQIENYIYACRQLQLLAFDLQSDESSEEAIDIHQTMEIPDEPESEEPSPVAEPETARTDTDEPLPSDSEQSGDPDSVSVDSDSQKTHKTPPLVPVQIDFELTTGSLEDIHILDIFHRCIIHTFSGEITFDNQAVKKTVFWKRGRIISAISDDIEERLDNFLFRKDIITEKQRDQLRTSPPELIGSPNEIIRQKILTIDKVFTVVKDQVESILFNLLTWRRGTYACTPNGTPPRDTAPLDLSAQGIIVDAMHKETISTVWHDKFPNLYVYYRKAPQSDHLKGVSLTPLERRISSIVTDPHQVESIVRLLDYPEKEVLLSLFTLEVTGIIERYKAL